MAKLFTDASVINVTAFISPYRVDRDSVRALMDGGDFVEVHIDCPVEECERRDPKGLYKKARAGEITGFTGVDDPYEAPTAAELVVTPADDGLQDVLALLRNQGIGTG